MAIQDEIPKSRLTLRYKTEVNGEPETVDLPLRLLVMGDFSQGTSSDRKVDLDERRLRNIDGTNTDSQMKDMGMSLSVVVPNKVDPEKDENLRINLPIDKINSFNPDEIADNIPKVKGLLMLKRLLLEVESNVANKKEFRQLLQELYTNEDAFKKVMSELEEYKDFKLPTGQAGDGGGDE